VISFIVGTTAELIKIAPVYHAIVARGTKPELWYTAQHMDKLDETLEDLGLPQPHVWLVPKDKAVHVDTPKQVPGWASTVARTAWSMKDELRATLRSDGKPPLVLVHGDTFTTPYGSIIGKRLLKARVGHIEAGARSGSLLSPFPEEANRKIAAKIVDIHFAPTAHDAHNLRNARGIVVDTGVNTVMDAMRLAIDAQPVNNDLPAEFGLATLHRFELVSRQDKYTAALKLLKEASEKIPVLYLAGPPERERIKQYGLADMFDDERLILRPKLRYLHFLPVLARAKFVVTDSGGLQAECAYIGLPAAIHRERTETPQHLGKTIVLTEMKTDVLEDFLNTYQDRRGESQMDKFHPSEIIGNSLASLGFC
jgi:UDP-N-acetylglucosamine 2-epimerase (non-hydrolysing)